MSSTYARARAAWEAASGIRTTRHRLKNFTYGRQWGDVVRLAGGETLTEEQLALQTGRRPLTNNLLRALVKSVVGRFRLNLMKSARDGTASAVNEGVAMRNRLDELDARALEEFLISGCAIQRVVLERRFEGAGVWVDNVNPDRFFCNRFLDPRGTDIRLCGMLHEMSLAEMRLRFGHGSRKRLRGIDEAYSRYMSSRASRSLSDIGAAPGPVGFESASDASLCRVVEVWTFESDERRKPCWICRYHVPDGTLIDQTRSPFPHGSHPFALRFYPLTDGEVHPFIEDVIDQQRHINLLITTIDHILSQSAKGVLLFPEDALPEGVDMREATRIWSNPGGVIPIGANASRMPVEVSSAGRSEGASGLLELEMKMFQQISGVSAALQGHDVGAGMSASLYDAQVQNSTVALMDVYETFHSFRADRDARIQSLVDNC